MDHARLALPPQDPAYAEIVAALSSRTGQRIAPGRAMDGLLADLVAVVADDRVRRDLGDVDVDEEAAELTAGPSPEQRLLAGDDPDTDPGMPTVWVQSGVSAIGTYTCEITYTDDTAPRVLSPGEVGPYADTLTLAVVQAEYQAAIIAQLRSVRGLTARDAWDVTLALRESTPQIDQKPITPLLVRASVGMKSGLPYLSIRLAGTRTRWRWDPASALEHAGYVRETVLVADLDAAYRRHLVGHVGLDDATARAMVRALSMHRHPRTLTLDDLADG